VRTLHIASGRLYGGIERMLATLAFSTEGSRLRCDFAVAADGRLLEELRDCHADVFALGNVRLSRPASVLHARRQVRDLLGRREYAAAVCHAPWSHAIFGGVVQRAGVPCVLWQHDAVTGASVVERASSRIGADLVICNSNWTARSTSAIFPDVPRRVVYCPVQSEPVASNARAAVRDALGAAADDVVVLAASRIEAWKGHANLIRALATLGSRRWTLWVAGGAQRRHERDYAAAIAGEVGRLGLESRVKFLGERRDVRQLLAGADLFAQANTEPEPFGVVFAEALLAGVPVVTTRMGGAPEIVDESCGRLVPGKDQAALVDALDELISNDRLRTSLGAAGVAHAFAVCDPSVVLPRLEAALLSVSLPTAA
jgi:glycosyltransferase involved in cell wall biosynthesis